MEKSEVLHSRFPTNKFVRTMTKFVRASLHSGTITIQTNLAVICCGDSGIVRNELTYGISAPVPPAGAA